MIEMLAQDVRYAARTFRRSPAFVLLTVLTIAVGVGANAAIFSVVNDRTWRPPSGGRKGPAKAGHHILHAQGRIATRTNALFSNRNSETSGGSAARLTIK